MGIQLPDGYTLTSVTTYPCQAVFPPGDLLSEGTPCTAYSSFLCFTTLQSLLFWSVADGWCSALLLSWWLCHQTRPCARADLLEGLLRNSPVPEPTPYLQSGLSLLRGQIRACAAIPGTWRLVYLCRVNTEQ